jgi:hypothetical protein
VHTRTTAGQATIEYIAAIALVVAILVVAGPAVGAPSLGPLVAEKIKLALCVAGGDICSDRRAREAGLQPCPLRSDLTGHEASATIFSLEVGHRWLLTVVHNSDGTVSVVRTASGSGGAAGGVSAGFSAGPVRFEVGESGAVRARLQVAAGWEFEDSRSADRFLEHALLNNFDDRDFPKAWMSGEGGLVGSESAGLAAGATGGGDRGELVGLAATESAALGIRRARDGGPYTLYGRVSVEDFEIALPGRPTIGPGRRDWLVEYTFARDGTPRALVYRHAEPRVGATRLTETARRLDLRDPANRAVAQPLLDVPLPWPKDLSARVKAVLGHIDAHGIVETTVSEVDDGSWGVAGSVSGDVKFGAGYKHVKVRRSLVSARARTGGPFERERYDCQVGQG